MKVLSVKRFIALTLALTLLPALAACGAADTTQETPASEAAPSTTAVIETSVAATAGMGAETAPERAASETAEAPVGTRVLVVYFSSANTVDAVSAATPYFDGVASTAVLANWIAAETGADLAKLTPVTDYPESYNDTADYAKQEQNDGVHPPFLPLDVNPEDYDVIFIGYPMWWYTLPMILDTFFDTYDFTGKTLVPFNTHEGSRDGGTWKTIAQLEPGATVPDGFAVQGRSAADADTKADLLDWLAGLGLQ